MPPVEKWMGAGVVMRFFNKVVCKIIGHKKQAYVKDGKMWQGCLRCTPECFIKKSVGDIMNDQINEIIDSMPGGVR